MAVTGDEVAPSCQVIVPLKLSPVGAAQVRVALTDCPIWTVAGDAASKQLAPALTVCDFWLLVLLLPVPPRVIVTAPPGGSESFGWTVLVFTNPWSGKTEKPPINVSPAFDDEVVHLSCPTWLQ